MNGVKTKCLGIAALILFAALIPFHWLSATLPPEVYYAANVAHAGSVDDAAYGPFDIGFSFDFFGTSYTQFYVTSNGWIGFDTPSEPGWSEYSNVAIPNASSPNNFIAAFWDDIIIHASGGVEYYQTIGTAPNRKCVTQMTNMGFFGDPTLLGTFTIILYETSNEIQVQYRIIVDNSSARAHGSSATIGLENADGSAGVQYSYNTESLSSEQAIRFTPSGGSYTYDDNALYEGILLGDGNAPTIPQLVSPSHQAIVPQQPVFQWQPCDYTNSYLFRIGNASNMSDAVETNVGTATTYTPDSPLTDGTDYYWEIFAIGTDGTTWSEILKVTASDSAPPTANPQTVWTTQGADALVTLNGTGGLGELTASISSLPLHGELYQYDAGGRGDPIDAVPTDVTDPDRNVIFHISDGIIGTDRGNFEFTVYDTTDWESDPSTVTVNVYAAPAVVTTAPLSTSATTATSGGNVTDDGGSSVIARGVCWSTSTFPTVAADHSSDGTGTGSFDSDLTGLTTGATYYVRSYAQNEDGIAYGNQYSFPAGLPILTTTALSEIGESTAKCGGNISVDGGAEVTARGVCWSADANPTVADDTTNNGSGTGEFTSVITGLDSATAYHVRAYATNKNGTAYGADRSFSTLAAPTEVAFSGNAGVAGAELHYYDKDYVEQFVEADSVGDFVIMMPMGGHNVIEPALTGYLFTPEYRTYDTVYAELEDQDFEASVQMFTISGETGVPHANLRYVDGGGKSVYADSTGHYTLSVSYNWTGTITPDDVYNIFTPEKRDYFSVKHSYYDQNFTPTYLGREVSGYIRDAQGDGVSGVEIEGFLKPVLTDIYGRYTARVYDGWTGTVTPTKEDYTFDPESVWYGAMILDLTDQDYTGFNLSLGVDDGSGGALPQHFSLLQNNPNPFNPSTSITILLPHSASATLKVYNLTGQEVATLFDGQMSAGVHTVKWNGRDNSGREVSTGVYLYRLQADDFVAVKKMMLLK